MENLTYEAVRRNPELLDELDRAARRERSKAVGRAVVGAFRALFSRPQRPATRRALQTSACG
ncbi:MAG: hypothetical protein ACREVS_06260 [Burkholderiales bacterium]